MKIYSHYSIVLLILLVSIGCSKDSQKEVELVQESLEYSINITVEPENTGNVSISNGFYEEGSNLKIEATPKERWKFSEWIGDLEGVDNPINIIVNSSKSITAKFVLIPQERDYSDISYEYKNSPLWFDHYEKPRLAGINSEQFFYDCGISVADFNADGYEDILMAKGKYNSVERYPLELFINDGTNRVFSLDNSLIKNNIGTENPRKAIVGDFNGDGMPDVFYADTGTEPPNSPFLFAYPSILLSSESGYNFEVLDQFPKAFTHGATSGDFDNDGDLDIFTSIGYMLINDGNANFQIDNSKFSFSKNGIYTCEFYDLNKDGYLDLIIGGHAITEGELESVTVFWGNGVDFNEDSSILLPNLPDWEVSLDFCFVDLKNDGKEEIIVNRVGGAVDPNDSTRYAKFYEGWRIQILENDGQFNYVDKTEDYIENYSGTDSGIVWLRVQDINDNGKIDLFDTDRGRKNTSSRRWEFVNGKFIRIN